MDNIQNGRQKHKISRTCGDVRKQKFELEDSTPIMNQVYPGCTQRMAHVDTKAVKSDAELFTRLTTTEYASDKDQTNVPFSLSKVTAWSYDIRRKIR